MQSKKEKTKEEPIDFCPVCGSKLLPKKCKMICKKCGYYMSCSDFI